ncbi:class I SAM-dependent methyltransferase [bacterium]|nr:class I SAM-dependent methyltransferase [bacterium]
MSIYSDLTPWYDRLFPVGDQQAVFLLHRLSMAEVCSVLDTGCGTGRHLEILADAGYIVAGLEPEADMAAEANRRLKGRGRVEVLSLQNAAQVPGAPFDVVLCLGNTLAHLLDGSALAEGLATLARVLKPGGLFIVQLVHFEKVLREGLDPFSVKVLEDGSEFHRSYDFSRAPERLGFSLRFENEAIRFEESFDLRPWTMDELDPAFEKHGFKIEELCGDWSGAPRQPDSPASIILARRR